jgi:ComF family protein
MLNKCLVYTHKIIHVLMPQQCLSCHKETLCSRGLCDDCWHELLSHPIPSTQYHAWGIDYTVYALGDYKLAALQNLIRLKNYHDDRGARIVGELLAQRFAAVGRDVATIIPVPLHWSRQIWRGFNQSMVVARELSSMWHVNLCPCIKRVNYTPQLTVYDVDARKNIMRNVFAYKTRYKGILPYIYNQHIALVDDLYTSGSTVHAMCHCLAASKPAHVSIFVGGRVV